MIKDSKSTYNTSGTRSSDWIKLKNQSLFSNSMVDTLDLIPIGAYYGKGQRAGKFGAFLLAAYNQKDGTFEAACKVGTGFSKEDLSNFTFENEILSERPPCYVSNENPDVWLLPNNVWEVRADTITKSPKSAMARHMMFITFGTGGLSLRFPRFVRVREDKAMKVTEEQL